MAETGDGELGGFLGGVEMGEGIMITVLGWGGGGVGKGKRGLDGRGKCGFMKMRNQCWWRRERFEGGVGWVCEPGGGN